MDARGLEREQAERLIDALEGDAADEGGIRIDIAYAGSCTAVKKVAASSVAGYISCWDPGMPIQRAPVREPAEV